MEIAKRLRYRCSAGLILFCLPLLACSVFATTVQAQDTAAVFATKIRPLMKAHCFDCHSADESEGGLDLQRFTSLALVRADVEAWQTVLRRVDHGEMPPKDQPPMKPADRAELTGWINGLLDQEARRRAGDPGPQLVRRLNNAEYNYAITDLTGARLNPSRQFPADGAAGEGFLNATDALTISSDQLAKYLDAAKDIAAHAVLLPEGIRFSPSKFSADWSNDVLEQIIKLHATYANEFGQIPFQRYLSASIEHRDAIETGQDSIAAIARRRRLSPKFLQTLWDSLHADQPTLFLRDLQRAWRTCDSGDVDRLAADISALQALLWHKRDPVGMHALDDRFIPPGIVVADTHTYRIHMPPPKDGKITFYLSSRVFADAGESAQLMLKGARFEAEDKPSISLHEIVPEAGATSDEVPLLDASRFGTHPSGRRIDEGNFVITGSETLAVQIDGSRVPGREFIVDVRIDSDSSPDAIVTFDLRLTPQPPRVKQDVQWTDVAGPFERRFLSNDPSAPAKLNLAANQFRGLFPARVCYPGVWVRDTTVTLERYHRGDAFLSNLILNDQEHARLNRLWNELHFISRDALQVRASYATLTQGEMTGYKEVAEVIHRRAEETEAAWQRAVPHHLDAVIELASRAYRRPLEESEQESIRSLYRSLRKSELPHEEAFRAVLARVFVSPHFLYRFESAPETVEPARLSNTELATRLSFFLWASIPDGELRQAAEAGKLRDPGVLRQQVRRMLKDQRSRRLAIEFGTQWLEVRNFDTFAGKNDKLFPELDADLRHAMYEESILMFQHLFQDDLPIERLIDADHTFANSVLARHYGLPNVEGSAFRRVDGVGQLGRGGILTLGSVLSKHSGASRTSPVLRGNWIAEILLGEALPRPPDDVPKLPEAETEDGLSVRQMVELHAQLPSCASCHQRIDPLGFALEQYDTIGRRREHDSAGRPIDARASLRDGTGFEGIDGLRQYLLTQRREDFVRQFCRKLLGYALGRRVILSDRLLLEEMATALKQNEGRVSAAIDTIVQSKQFQFIRGTEIGDQP